MKLRVSHCTLVCKELSMAIMTSNTGSKLWGNKLIVKVAKGVCGKLRTEYPNKRKENLMFLSDFPENHYCSQWKKWWHSALRL